jgi:hypothetical protein
MARNVKKKASNDYIDARANTAKAEAAIRAALERYADAAGAEESCRAACMALEIAVAAPPVVFRLASELKP